MSTLVKITLAAALILSIAVPFGAFAWVKNPKAVTKRRWALMRSYSSAP